MENYVWTRETFKGYKLDGESERNGWIENEHIFLLISTFLFTLQNMVSKIHETERERENDDDDGEKGWK